MHSIIHTSDISNLSVLALTEGEDSQPITIDLIGQLLAGVQEDADHPDGPDVRSVVFVSADMAGAFAEEPLSHFFDPIELVADVTAGNIGTVLAMQVVRVDDKTNLLAVASVTDVDEGITIDSFRAATVNL